MANPNDVPMKAMRDAAAAAREASRARVRAHGGTLVYVAGGRIVGEAPNGRRVDLGQTTATTVTLTKRTWKIR